MNHDHEEVIVAMGNRIKGTHVHDNNRLKDVHLPPGGTNNPCDSIKWDKVLRALRDTGYEGFLTLEVVYEFNEGIQAYMNNMYDCVAKLEDCFLGK